MELYEKIRSIREDQDIKQKDLAKYLHMQPNTYNAYEKGKRTLTAEQLRGICIFLNISADELFELNINDPYNGLNKKNKRIIENLKKSLIISQKVEKNLKKKKTSR